jgi:hypothetical protein
LHVVARGIRKLLEIRVAQLQRFVDPVRFGCIPHLVVDIQASA